MEAGTRVKGARLEDLLKVPARFLLLSVVSRAGGMVEQDGVTLSVYCEVVSHRSALPQKLVNLYGRK